MGSVSGCHSRRLVFREEPYACHPPEITPIPLWRISQNGVTPIATITHGTLSIRKLNAIKKGCPIRSIPTSAVPGLPIKREHGVRLPHTCRESLLAKTTLKPPKTVLPRIRCRRGPGYESSQRKARSLGGQLMDGRLGSSEAAEQPGDFFGGLFGGRQGQRRHRVHIDHRIRGFGHQFAAVAVLPAPCPAEHIFRRRIIIDDFAGLAGAPARRAGRAAHSFRYRPQCRGADRPR